MASYSRFVDAKNSTANNEFNQVYNVIYIDAAKLEELMSLKLVLKVENSNFLMV